MTRRSCAQSIQHVLCVMPSPLCRHHVHAAFMPRSRRVCLRRVCAALMCSDRRAPVADAPPPARRGRHAHLQRRAAQCSASGCSVRPSAASARRGANTATNGAARRVCRGRRAARVVELRQRESNIRNTGTEYPEGATTNRIRDWRTLCSCASVNQRCGSPSVYASGVVAERASTPSHATST